jgi:hypothetical protein
VLISTLGVSKEVRLETMKRDAKNTLTFQAMSDSPPSRLRWCICFEYQHRVDYSTWQEAGWTLNAGHAAHINLDYNDYNPTNILTFCCSMPQTPTESWAIILSGDRLNFCSHVTKKKTIRLRSYGWKR